MRRNEPQVRADRETPGQRMTVREGERPSQVLGAWKAFPGIGSFQWGLSGKLGSERQGSPVAGRDDEESTREGDTAWGCDWTEKVGLGVEEKKEDVDAGT